VTRRELLATLAAAATCLACRRSEGAPQPVEVAFGRDECSYCRMIIDDPRLAAEFVEAGGRTHKFGEPGCLVNWLRDGSRPPGAAFVTDGSAGGWVPAPRATYVVGRVRTPMSYDVVAYRAAPQGTGAARLRDWPSLLKHGVTGGPR
jgi:copper chaperone NosL